MNNISLASYDLCENNDSPNTKTYNIKSNIVNSKRAKNIPKSIVVHYGNNSSELLDKVYIDTAVSSLKTRLGI